MAFTSAERVKIRRYMGATALYQNLDTRLESAMTAVESDSSQEDEVRDVILVRLEAIDAKMAEYESYMLAGQVDEMDVDAARGLVMLRSQGRIFAKRLAAVLGFDAPRSDAFSSAPSNFNRSGLT